MMDTKTPNVVNKPETLNFGSPDFDSEEYALVARTARLRDVRLIESRFQVKADLLRVFDPTDGSYELGYSGEMSSFGFDADSGFAIGSYEWVAVAKHGRKKAMSTKAKYMVIYTNLKGMKELYVATYYNKLAKFTSYPYFRGFFALNTASASIIIPPLPSLTDRVD